MWDKKYLEELEQYRERERLGGGEKRIEKQHASGKMTARERIDYLFDEGTFMELNSLVEARPQDGGFEVANIPGDGVVIGYGDINGRPVCVASEDFTVMGGTLGEYHSKKFCQIMDLAYNMKIPFISINDSGGARIEEGISSIAGYSGIFYRNTRASGVIPQISVVMGPCAGGACYSPAISDFVFMTKETSKMFITGPAVVKQIMGEDTTAEELGGARMHAEKSGVAHFVYDDDKKCLEGVKRLLEYLPDNNANKAPYRETVRIDNSYKIEEIVPDNQRKTYDVKMVIDAIVDKDTVFEVHQEFAKNIVTCFARLDGETIGIIANQPLELAGALDINSSEKAARFIRFCDCFNIPLLTMVDVGGFFPGTIQEHNGIIRKGAKLLYAYSEATVPRVTLLMRKAFGGAYIAMNSKGMGADVVMAWPIAQAAVMGAEGAIDILYKKELSEIEDPIKRRKELTEKYEEYYMNPYYAARRGYIDEVIRPDETRQKLSIAFKALKNKKMEPIVKKHGNIPL